MLIEEYGRFVKQKAKAILSEERARVEPFTTSILDGIDIREFIRNWHRHKIFVRTASRLAGEVGSVVVIFDEGRDDRYTYLTTWLGEHQNRIRHGILFHAPVRQHCRTRNRTGRIRRPADDVATAPVVRCVV